LLEFKQSNEECDRIKRGKLEKYDQKINLRKTTRSSENNLRDLDNQFSERSNSATINNLNKSKNNDISREQSDRELGKPVL
jgi:hypothetical protein